MANELALQREMNPANWQMIQAIAETTAMARSEQAKIAKHLIFCYENDLPLSLAVNGGLYTVNGRVEVEGTVIRGQIRKHPDYDYKIITLNEKECVIEIGEFVPEDGKLLSKYKYSAIGQASFTWDDVIVAGLQDKENYKKYPTDMLLNRATSRAYKRFCPDIFMQSVYVNGEISNQPKVTTIDSDGVIVPTIDEMMRDNPQGVLDAMNAGCNSQLEIYEYLQEVE
jgi:hypothetical protein